MTADDDGFVADADPAYAAADAFGYCPAPSQGKTGPSPRSSRRPLRRRDDGDDAHPAVAAAADKVDEGRDGGNRVGGGVRRCRRRRRWSRTRRRDR